MYYKELAFALLVTVKEMQYNGLAEALVKNCLLKAFVGVSLTLVRSSLYILEIVPVCLPGALHVHSSEYHIYLNLPKDQHLSIRT